MGAWNAKDITGLVFGKLRAVKRLGTRRGAGSTRATWEFTCDCGGKAEKILAQARLYGHQGCAECVAKVERKPRIDILGQKFGCLTVVRRIEGSWWECRCDCGAHCQRRVGNLRADVKRRGINSCPNCRARAELIGQRFGMIVVESKIRMTRSGALWLCRCDCGGASERTTSNLRSTKTPGCPDCETQRRAEIHRTHGGAFGGKSRLYSIWQGMRKRCANLDDPHYGGKGIRVCKQWDDFSVFRQWSHENGYVNGLSIDRIDPARGYSPGNCEWVTRSENSRRVFRPRILDLAARKDA